MDGSRHVTGRRPMVLIADDDPGVRLALHVLLEGDGYGVEEAATGQAALQVCEGGGVDLVVTDVLMPDVDGLEVLRTLRRTHPRLPVIVLTGAEVGPEGTLAALATHLGARHVLLKPVAVAALRELVARLVGPPR